MILGEDDAFEIKSEICGLAARFYQFGGALGLRASELDKIHENFHRDADRAIGRVIDTWLAQRYTVERFGRPSWRALVKAVDSPAGGNNYLLAKKITTDHPGIDRSYKESYM